METNSERAHRVERITEQIKPLLSGQGPDVQGAVLADLLALWLAGHHPDLRNDMLDGLLLMIDELTAINEKILFGEGGFPTGGLA